MVEALRKKLKDDGRSLKWFHKTHIKKELLSYTYFIMQLCGHAKMHDSVEEIIKEYVAD